MYRYGRAIPMIFILFFACAWGDEQSFAFFSNVPPVQIEVININPEYCDKSCLRELSKKNKIISFVARFDRNIDDKELQNLMEEYANQLGIYYKLRFDPLGKRLDVALLFPKKNIGKYSTTTIDTILAYLTSRNVDFAFKIFDSGDESVESIARTASKINDEHFNFMIAVLTKPESLAGLEDIDIPIYIPTMSAIDKQTRSNIVFGGIDYRAQMELLMSAADKSGVFIIYNDDSSLGSDLGRLSEELSVYVLKEETITNQIVANFSQNMQKQEMFLVGSNIILNTPIVKSGLILSQIGISDEKPSAILSTQVNYNPTLLSLLRGVDTGNIIIANSINETDNRLLEYGFLLSSDMKYDWVNYSTALGMDLFLSNMSKDIERYFVEKFEDNRIIYHVDLYKIQNGAFVKTDSPAP